MADEKKLIYTLVMQNEKYLKENEKNKRSMMELQKVSGKSIGQITRDFKTFNTSATQNFNKFGKAANDNLGGARRALGQLGFQVQDIAVQLQGGQNPLLVLSQQGSQVASIFGPGGAVFGAFLAVGAAIGTAFLPKLFESVSGVEKLDTALKSLNAIMVKTENSSMVLSDAFGDLAKQSKVLADFAVKRALVETQFALEAAKEEARDLIESLSPGDIGGRFQTLNFGILALQKSFREGKVSITEFEKEFAKLFNSAKNIPQEFLDVANGIGEIGQRVRELEGYRESLEGGFESFQTESQAKEFQDRIKIEEKFVEDSAKLENKRVEALQASFFSISDSLRGEEQQLIDSYNSRLSIIKSFEKKFPEFEAEANETRIALKEDYNKKVEALEKSRLKSLGGFVSGSLALIEQGIGKETALGKVAFAANKALSIAEMIVATENASVKALTLGPIAGPIASAAIKGLGYASIGIVAGQTIASFEGGGFTGNGPRSGGMDGHGGKLAMLHPNEKVIDLQQSRSANDGYKIEVHNYAGANVNTQIDEERRIIAIMVDQANNTSSPMGNALQQKYNLRPRGTR